MKESRSFRIADKLIRWLCKPELVEDIQGDLREYYAELMEYSSFKRSSYFWFHVIHFLRPSLLKTLSGTQKLNHYDMFKFIFKTTKRTFFKQKLISSISLLSLVFGALCFHLIYVWINNEVNMNKFHKNLDNIYAATFKANPDSEFSPMPVTDFFDLNYQDYPGIQTSTLVHLYRENEIKIITDQTEFPSRAFVVDSTFFKLFDFDLLIGDKRDILVEPTNIILTKSFAQRIFGSENPMGKTLSIRCDNTGSYQVAGILEDIPSASSMKFDFIIPRHSERRWRRLPMELILTDSNFDLNDFNTQIAKIAQANPRFPHSIMAYYPLSSIYFESPFLFLLYHKYGNWNSILTMGFIALMIVLITALSFIGLQTTHQLSSVKKTGVKRVIGATGTGLFMEVLVSRLFYVALASIIALIIFEMVFPFYASAMEFYIDRNRILDITSILSVTGIISVISILIGYLNLNRMNAKEALRNQFTFLKVPKMQRFLSTFQYTIAIVLIAVTTVVYNQYNFMLEKDIGIETSNIVSVDFFDMMNGSSSNSARQETLSQRKLVMDKMRVNPDIIHFSQGVMPVDRSFDKGSWKMLKHPNDYTSINKMSVDPTYDDLLKIEVIEGRFFSDSLDELMTHKAVINEAAMKYWGIEDIKSTKLANSMWGGVEDPFEIIGVVKDYHYEHLSNKIEPLILLYRSYEDYNFLVKVHPQKREAVTGFLADMYNEINPKGIFQYEWLDDRVEGQYIKEKRVGKTYLAFTMIALLLSAIGLFTFALHETKRRTKEIGIRKINGASIGNVFSLLSTSFLKSVLVAFIIAGPIAWILMHQWLDNFANRISISWWIFGFAGIVALVMALIAISWQTVKVAKKNPVDSLRYE